MAVHSLYPGLPRIFLQLLKVDVWRTRGNAIADVLFGDYNPGGKLPVTFPRHSGQFPFYYNVSATKARAKYVDMPGTPMFEFGYGLSYTKFEYSNLKLSSKEIKEAAV